MNDLSVSYIYGQAWELTKKNLLPLVLVVLFYYLLVSGATIWSILPPNFDFSDFGNGTFVPREDPNFIGNLINILLACFFSVGFYTSALRISRGVGGVSVDSFLRPLAVYVKFIAVGLIVGVATALGLILFIVPGFYVAIRLVFATLYTLDHPEAGIIESIKASWQMTKGHMLELIGLSIVAIFVMLLGYLCCCVGTLVAFPVVILSFTQIYLVLNEQFEQNEALL